MKRITTLLTMLFAIGLLVACAAPVPSAAPAEESTTETSAAETRTVTHAMGETEIPTNPQRVVTLDAFFTLTPLVELGVPVVGSMSLGDDDPYPGLIAAEQEEITSVGFFEMNLESIAALEPDLIIGVDFVQPPYEELSQIAPTVVIATSFDWRDQHRTLAQIVGKEAEAEAGIAEYEAQVAALRDALPDDVTASVMTMHNEAILPMGPGAWAPVKVMDEVGLARPADEVTDDPEAWFLPLSSEVWPDIAGDVLFYTAGYPGMDEATAELVAEQLEKPIWQQIPAVQNGRAYSVDTRCWETFGGLRSAQCVLGEIASIFDENLPMTEAAAGDEAENEVVSCDKGLRSIDTAFGPTCIPDAPERVIALNENIMANLIALDAPPIAVQDWSRRDFTAYLGDTTGTIASVGNSDGPNYEAMLALNPDVIVAMPSNVDEESMETLTQIAPVAVAPADNTDWRGNILYVGEVIGKVDEAEALVAATDARLAEFRAAYEAQALADEEIAIIRSRADSFNIYHGDFFIVKITEDAGLKMPASFDEITERRLSLEAIELIEGDRLFVMVRNERESGAFIDLSASPLWQTIPAVQNDEVYLVNWSVWVAGWNIVGANLVIDDLYFYMLDEESPTPSPLAGLIIPEYGPQFDEERLGLE
ncbi:MAG: ABC transporter substrate-binding protein [Chloroflexota bacterium]